MSTVIAIENLSKSYRLGVIGGGTLREDLNRWWARVRGRADLLQTVGEEHQVRQDGSLFWALRNVDLEIREGEALGIVGRNGAGKSTLLKILSRVTSPSEGQVGIRGRIASLLEVGTGFHPELTGRENIFLNGAILGMTRGEIRRHFDEIVAFAEIAPFIDTPVKRYSSGMYVRLAFAVAAHLEPEILVVDEVLAVGDAQFQKKCLGKMRDVSRGGRTVLFVSHHMGAVTNLCTRAAWLEGGKVRQVGDARQVVDAYLADSSAPSMRYQDFRGRSRPVAADARLRIVSLTWGEPFPLRHGEPFSVRVEFETRSAVDDVAIGFGFSSFEGTRLLTYETDFPRGRRPSLRGRGVHAVEFRVPELPLAPGLYNLDIGSRSGDVYPLDFLSAATQVEVVPGRSTPGYIIRQDAGVRLHCEVEWDQPAGSDPDRPSHHFAAT